jgi:nicotinamidase-related amidase
MTDTHASLDARRAMLLVMDYQQGVMALLPDAGELLGRAAQAIAAARAAGVAVGYLRVAFTAADYAALPATNQRFAALAATGRMDDAAPETAIHPAVAPQPGDLVVRKTRTGAFSTTDLHARLRERGVDTLVLAGVATGGVVLSTVRDAADRDYRLYVLADACADRDPEVHEVLLRTILPRQATVLATADLPGLFGAA